MLCICVNSYVYVLVCMCSHYIYSLLILFIVAYSRRIHQVHLLFMQLLIHFILSIWMQNNIYFYDIWVIILLSERCMDTGWGLKRNWHFIFLPTYVCTLYSWSYCMLCDRTLYCYRIQNSTSIPPVSYVFPNGYNLALTVDRFKLTEALFDASSHNLKVM